MEKRRLFKKAELFAGLAILIAILATGALRHKAEAEGWDICVDGPLTYRIGAWNDCARGRP